MRKRIDLEYDNQRWEAMNIYLISQTKNNGYDTYDSAVVVAESEEDAKSIHPNGSDWDGVERGFGAWVSKQHVAAKLIGTTDMDKCVICASFNAG
jgi:hypothetical protein